MGSGLLVFLRHWVKLAACMAPALLVSLLRLRRLQLLLPITLVCGWFFVWWLGADLHENLHRAFATRWAWWPRPQPTL